MSERPTGDEEDPLLKPGEVGRLMNVTARTVSLWSIKGKLTAVLTPGGHRRFRKSDVMKLLDNVEEF